VSTQQDPFANPKYSREELRAMARDFLARGERCDLRAIDAQVRLFEMTGIPPRQQMSMIKEMAK
jgi:hypothetical protein